MNSNKITVIVPVYNSEKFLAKCINSIKNQTYTDLEILLINDGSTDSSLQICLDFAAKDNRIIVIDKENGGVSSARNMGLDRATGDYIGFVDSDDYISEDMYEKLINAIIKNECDISECGYYQIDKDERIFYDSRFHPQLITGSYDCTYSFVADFNTSQFVCNKLFRKDLFTDIRFPGFTSSEDYIVNIKTLFVCRKKIIISDSCYYYYKNENSATNVKFKLNRMDTVKAGIQAFAFHQERYRDICKYISVYICDYILFCYRGLKRSDIHGKRVYIRELLKDYRKYFSYISKIVYQIPKFKRKRKHFILFRICPSFYNFLLNIHISIYE